MALLALLCALSLPASAASSEELARQAKSAMAAGRYTEAASAYRQLVAAAPGETGLRFNLALALHSSGSFSEAVAQLQRVTREQPAFLNAWLVLGLAFQKLGKPELAVAPLERVVKSEPQNRIALLELGDALLSTGRPLDAARHFTALSLAEPNAPKPLQGLANAYLAHARQLFDRLNSQAPDSPFAAALMAQTLSDQGQYRKAFALSRKAQSAEPPIPDLDTLVAGIYHAAGHNDWAETLKSQAAKTIAKNCAAGDLACLFISDRVADVIAAAGTARTPYALYWLSRAYGKLAATVLNRLSALPESAEWHEVLGESYRLQGRKEDSITEWRAAVRLAPDDSFGIHGLARALWLHRDYAEAQSLLERLLKASPDSPELNYELGDVLVEQQSLEEALAYLKKAIAGGLQTGEAHAALGLALLKTGNAQEAIPHLQAALPGDVDGSLHHQLGRAWQQMGNAQKAKQYFDQQARIAERPAIQEPDITPP